MDTTPNSNSLPQPQAHPLYLRIAIKIVSWEFKIADFFVTTSQATLSTLLYYTFKILDFFVRTYKAVVDCEVRFPAYEEKSVHNIPYTKDAGETLVEDRWGCEEGVWCSVSKWVLGMLGVAGKFVWTVGIFVVWLIVLFFGHVYFKTRGRRFRVWLCAVGWGALAVSTSERVAKGVLGLTWGPLSGSEVFFERWGYYSMELYLVWLSILLACFTWVCFAAGKRWEWKEGEEEETDAMVLRGRENIEIPDAVALKQDVKFFT